jgi:hypothetical protein
MPKLGKSGIVELVRVDRLGRRAFNQVSPKRTAIRLGVIEVLEQQL